MFHLRHILANIWLLSDSKSATWLKCNGISKQFNVSFSSLLRWTVFMFLPFLLSLTFESKVPQVKGRD